MPRIRTLKPEAPQHRKVGRLSIHARWLWLVMITQADDDGRLVADPGQLRITAFPYDRDVTDEQVAGLKDEIGKSGLVCFYEVNGVPYAWFPSWHDHQRINRPTPSKLPSYQQAMTVHGGLTEPSMRTHAGSEGIKDGINIHPGRGDQGRDVHPSDEDLKQRFDTWWSAFPRRASAGLGSKSDAWAVWVEIEPEPEEVEFMLQRLQEEEAEDWPDWYDKATGEPLMTPAAWLMAWSKLNGTRSAA